MYQPVFLPPKEDNLSVIYKMMCLNVPVIKRFHCEVFANYYRCIMAEGSLAVHVLPPQHMTDHKTVQVYTVHIHSNKLYIPYFSGK